VVEGRFFGGGVRGVAASTILFARFAATKVLNLLKKSTNASCRCGGIGRR
jgi:hypothetical protein